jgi:hypothetical protein
MSNTQHPDCVEVSDEAGRRIWLRRKLGFGRRNKTLQTAVELGGDPANVEGTAGAWMTASLYHRIVAWEGPDLDGVPITLAALDDLDPDLGDLAVAKIGELQSEGAVDPNSITTPSAPGTEARQASESPAVST